MIIRKIKPDELKRTDEIFAIAFEFDMDNSKSAEQVYEEAAKSTTSRGAHFWGEKWAAFEDNDTTIMSHLSVTPFPAQFDGNRCTMRGIGGVSTLPQYRRRGGIRACFEAALPEMYKNGDEFSYLQPFSTAYYRKFGYELCCEQIYYHLLMSFIPAYPASDGTCYLLEQGSDLLGDIKQIYNQWQDSYNMMVINEDFEYAWAVAANPPKDQNFTYVYKSKDGTPKGYMTFYKADEPTGRNLICKRFLFTDIEGFGGLMNLARTLASDHMFFSFRLPVDKAIAPLLPEWSMGAVKCDKLYYGMVRVVNVQKVLKMARYKGSGELVIAVTDPQIPENNVTFHLKYENGKATSVSQIEAAADITLGINAFSQLIVGVCETRDIEFMPGVKLNTDLEKLSHVFYRKPVNIDEYF